MKIDHPRFEEAVEAAADDNKQIDFLDRQIPADEVEAAAAADDNKQAIAAAAILEGPEALEHFGLST